MDEHERPTLPRVRHPGYRDPTEGVDWANEPFHRAFVRNHLFRGGTRLPAGFVVWIYVAVVAGLIYGAFALTQWWTER